ncbi:hypothetical protein J6P92_05725 [bacterium]|nr:hypothetical protein [bacterium]
MKKVLFLISLLIIANPVFAECTNCKSSKCMDLMSSMYDKRATLFNVLNLSADQQKCKDTMDMNYMKEAGDKFEKYEQEKFTLKNMVKNNTNKSALKKQKKVVKNLEEDLENLNKKYEKEFKSILNSEQKGKFNTILKMQKKEVRYCQKDKAFYKRDPKLRPFGEKMYYKDTEEILCPKHHKWHIFGFKHKIKN